MPYDMRGLLSNPLLGMGIGLMRGADPGESFGSGAQQGLQNMMLMHGQNQRNQMQDLQTKRLAALMAEEEQQQTIQEAMRAGGNPAWIGNAPQPAESAPYMQSGAEMFPGEQPMGGLMSQTPAQPATGMYAQNPQMGGLMSDMYQADPMATQQMMARSMLDSNNQTQPFGFNDYMGATEEQRAMYDQYKGWDSKPSDLEVYDAYKNMNPQEQKMFRDSKRAPQWLDYGPGFVDPSAPPGSRTLDPSVPLEASEQPLAPPGTIKKDIIGAAVEKAEGGDIGQRLTSYPVDMRVSEDLLSSIEETQGQLAQLFGMTNYETTGVASYLNNLAASDAKAWDNVKTTVQSRLGLDKMMELKAGSATGSTGFGALNTQELRLLVGNLGELEQATDPDDIKRVILSINRQLGDKTRVIRSRMDSKRAWYDKNKGRLSESNRVEDAGVVDWNDLP